jgi:hypothetical protein
MRRELVALSMLLASVNSAAAQVGIGIATPNVSIGINIPVYPELVPVPGYPVYYAPGLSANFFFYDGLYWVYRGDHWYASSWYNGPWGLVSPFYVPVFVLRVPVGYYRAPPGHFRGWRADAPPRWGQHWGRDWEQRRSGWDRWDHRSAVRPAPLPTYQRQYSGNRYPRVEQQAALHGQNYRYQPRDAVVKQHYQERALQRTATPAPREQQRANRESIARQDIQRSNPPPRPQQERSASQGQTRQPPPGAAQHEQPMARSSRENGPQGHGAWQESRRGQLQGQGQGKGHGKGEER